VGALTQLMPGGSRSLVNCSPHVQPVWTWHQLWWSEPCPVDIAVHAGWSRWTHISLLLHMY